jgi:hypothetical protein
MVNQVSNFRLVRKRIFSQFDLMGDNTALMEYQSLCTGRGLEPTRAGIRTVIPARSYAILIEAVMSVFFYRMGSQLFYALHSEGNSFAIGGKRMCVFFK